MDFKFILRDLFPFYVLPTLSLSLFLSYEVGIQVDGYVCLDGFLTVALFFYILIQPFQIFITSRIFKGFFDSYNDDMIVFLKLGYFSPLIVGAIFQFFNNYSINNILIFVIFWLFAWGIVYMILISLIEMILEYFSEYEEKKREKKIEIEVRKLKIQDKDKNKLYRTLYSFNEEEYYYFLLFCYFYKEAEFEDYRVYKRFVKENYKIKWEELNLDDKIQMSIIIANIDESEKIYKNFIYKIFDMCSTANKNNSDVE
ncbi:hypothetical protein MWN41_08990, partial [Ornithobacterium rhinotracheale]|uniref:hypothetical protein n=1 Tax=Ornithobacterium rhinotracheale TaxID=28251 RepID=UPI001FF6E760